MVPEWLTMARPETGRFARSVNGRDFVIAAPKKRELLRTLRCFKGYSGFDVRYEGFFKWWRVGARTAVAEDLAEALVAEAALAPMPAEEISLAIGFASGQRAQESFWFSDDTYNIRINARRAEETGLLRVVRSNGGSLHAEWGRGDFLQVVTRKNDVHRGVRASLARGGIYLDSRFFENFNPGRPLH